MRNATHGLEPGTALDVGAADGILTELLRANGWDAIAIDPGGVDGPHQERKRLDEVPGEGRFDLVTLVHSLEHLPDTGAALSKVRELLAPTGQVYVAVPNYGGTWARLEGECWPWLMPADHHFHFTPTSLGRALGRAGFAVEWIQTSSRMAPSLSQAWLMARGAYEKCGPLHCWPVSGVAFRLANTVGRVSNWIADLNGLGAEIETRARAT